MYTYGKYLAASVALFTAMPTFAWRNTGEQPTPSPVIPTLCPNENERKGTMFLNEPRL